MRYRVSIASGKGGTGKTLLAVNLTLFMKEVLHKSAFLVDFDVEEPNSSIFLKTEPREVFEASRNVPKFIKSRCTNCGVCANVCMFNALIKAKEHVLIYKNLCHSCNACAKLCPEGALVMENSRIGDVRVFESKLNLTLIDGILDLKEEMSTPLIESVKKKAEELSKDADLIIYDSPPGTSCSYVESIKDSDLVLIVTEPTPFGRNDSALAIETAKRMNKKTAVIINRAGEDEAFTEDFFKKQEVAIIAAIKDSLEIAKSYSRGETIYGKFDDFDSALNKVADFIIKEAQL